MEKIKYELHVFEVRERIINGTLDKNYIKKKIKELINDDPQYKDLYNKFHKSAMRCFKYLSKRDLVPKRDSMFVEEATLINLLGSDKNYRQHQRENYNNGNQTYYGNRIYKDRLVYYLHSKFKEDDISNYEMTYSGSGIIETVTGFDIETSKYALIPRQLKEISGNNVSKYPHNFDENNILLFRDMLENDRPNVLEVIHKYQELEFTGVKDDEINDQMREIYDQPVEQKNPKMIKSI